MEYAPTLYDIANLKCGYTTISEIRKNPKNPKILGAFFQDGSSFGLLENDKGRRVAMRSKKYERQESSLNEHIDNILLRPERGLEYRVVSLNAANQSNFVSLLKDNPNLREADKPKHGKALLEYANDEKYPYDDINSSTAKAAKNFIAKYRNAKFGQKRRDRELARQEYNNLDRSYRSNQFTLLTGGFTRPTNPETETETETAPTASHASIPLPDSNSSPNTPRRSGPGR